MTERITGSATIGEINYNYDLNTNPSAHLVLMVHGKAGNKKVMSIFRSKFTDDFSFIYPEAPNQDPEFGGFSWWLENSIENYQKAAASLAQFTSACCQQHQLTPVKVTGAGFSQGGAVLAAAIQVSDLELDCLAMISSYFPRLNQPVKWPEIFIFHGTEDKDVEYQEAMKLSEYLANSAVKFTLVIDQVGHKISSRGMKMLRSWILLIR